jgi:alcohol dehydrogenase, propanol-preferring
VIGQSADGAGQARDLGAERYVATRDQDPAEALRGWDYGADLIVNSAPSTAAAVAASGGLAPDGTLLLLGYSPEPLVLPTQPMVLGRRHVMANPSGSPHDLRDTLAFAGTHGILPDIVPIKLEEAPDTLAGMAAGKIHRRHVIAF